MSTVRAVKSHEFCPERKSFVVFLRRSRRTPVLHVLGLAQEAFDDVQLRLFDYQVTLHRGYELSQVFSAKYHPPMDISMGRVSAQHVGSAPELRVEQPDRGGVSVIGTYPKMDTGGPLTLSGVVNVGTNRPFAIKETRQVAHTVTCNHTASIPQGEQG